MSFDTTCLQGVPFEVAPNGARYIEIGTVDKKTGGYNANADGSLAGVRFFFVPDYQTSSLFIEFMLGVKLGRARPRPQNGPREMFPGSAIFATSATVEGIGKAKGPVEFPNYKTGCVVTVNYTTLPYNAPADEDSGSEPGQPQNSTFLTTSINISSEVLTLAKAGIEWLSGQPFTKFDQAPHRSYGVGTVTFTRHLVTEVNINDMVAALNTVNSINIQGFGVKTLLVQGFSYNVTVQSLGNASTDVNINCGFRELKWDNFYNAKTAAFEEVKKKGGAPLYEQNDFLQLIPELA
jgi:hypothetical protein